MGRCDAAAGGVCRYEPKGGGGECRAKAGPCDVKETCDGTSLACPPDRLEPEGVECRAADTSNVCAPAAYCTGDSAVCPDTWAEEWTPCDPGLGECYVGECDGTGSCQASWQDMQGWTCTMENGWAGQCCYGMCTFEEEGIC